jgi:hypothetical protein
MGEEHENHTRLHDAGLIDKHSLKEANSDEYDKLTSLTADEVATLIAVREKLGGGQMTQTDTSSF